MTHAQHLRYVGNLESDLQEAVAREGELREELKAVLARPYEAVFKLCEMKCNDGTSQLIGILH